MEGEPGGKTGPTPGARAGGASCAASFAPPAPPDAAAARSAPPGVGALSGAGGRRGACFAATIIFSGCRRALAPMPAMPSVIERPTAAPTSTAAIPVTAPLSGATAIWAATGRPISTAELTARSGLFILKGGASCTASRGSVSVARTPGRSKSRDLEAHLTLVPRPGAACHTTRWCRVRSVG